MRKRCKDWTGALSGALAVLVGLSGAIARPEDGVAQQMTIRDSAGIRIVENTIREPNQAPVRRLTPQPLLSIGAVDGEPFEEFTEITTALFLGMDSIAVVNSSRPAQVRIFNIDGSFLGSFWDPGLGRFTHMTGQGWVRTVRTPWRPGAVAGSGLPELVVAGYFNDGTFLLRHNRWFGETQGTRGRSRQPLYRASLDGSLFDTLGIFVYADYAAVDGRPAPPIFGRNMEVITDGERWFLGLGDAFVVDVFDRDGRQVERWSRSFQPVEATQALVDQHIAYVSGRAQESVRVRLEDLYANRPAMSTLPAYSRGWIIDAAGRLWVRGFVLGGETEVRWSVFAPDGIYLGDVVAPARFRLTAAEQGRVLGIWTDDDDVQSVRVYEFERFQESGIRNQEMRHEEEERGMRKRNEEGGRGNQEPIGRSDSSRVPKNVVKGLADRVWPKGVVNGKDDILPMTGGMS